MKRKCTICGFDRTLDSAHLASGKWELLTDIKGGLELRDITIDLCPNQHRLYDYHGLNEKEVRTLPNIFRMYYEAPFYEKESVLRKIGLSLTNLAGVENDKNGRE